MNIDSKEFEAKFKDLIEEGYCKECISIMTSPLTKGKLCKKCKTLFIKENK